MGAPSWFPAEATLPDARWHCYRKRDKLGVNLWSKTGALLAAVLRTFPARRFYLKIDSDTLILPHGLIRFLQALHAATPRSQPLYFGSNRIAQKARFCSGRNCLLLSAPWRQLEKLVAANASAAARRGANAVAGANGKGGGYYNGEPYRYEGSECESDVASYAQGGAYGFDRRALTALVHNDCLDHVAAAVRAYDRKRSVSLLFEDEAVGLCMRLRGVRLITCGCFYDWGPCDIRPGMVETSCLADRNGSRICHFPLSVHKLKKLEWFDGWWNLLSSREPAALAALDAWRAAPRHDHTRRLAYKV